MLRISTKVDYGVLLLRTLAQEATSSPVSVRFVSKKTGLPERYLARIANVLARADIITATEGTKGGYALARNPKKIPIGDVVAALEPHRAITRCAPQSYTACRLGRQCGLAPWWQSLDDTLTKILHTQTIADIL